MELLRASINMRLLSVFLISAAFAKILILEPEDLESEIRAKYNSTVLPSSMATFTFPRYNTSLEGQLYRSDPSLDACNPLPSISFQDLNSLLLVSRGNCTFLSKGFNAQQIGAKGLIIVDDREENVEEVYLTDSSKSGIVHIPIFLVSQTDGNLLNQYIEDGKSVKLQLEPEEQKYKRVSLQVLFSADSRKAMQFFEDFQSIFHEFDHSVLKFQPLYALYSDSNCTDANFTCDNPDCVSGGRYCAKVQEDKREIPGKEVMLENLRELCIFEYTKSAQDSDRLWFDYMAKFNKKCIPEAFNVNCSDSILSEIGAPMGKLEECLTDSVIGDIENLMLQEALSQSSSLLSKSNTSILLNDEEFEGGWDLQSVGTALCALYQDPPEACEQFSTPEDNQKKTEDGDLGDVLLGVFFCVMVGLGGWMFFQARKKQVHGNQVVNEAFSKYYALQSEGTQATHRGNVDSF